MRRMFTVMTEMPRPLAGVVLARMIVRLTNPLPAGDVEFRGRHARTSHSLSPDGRRIDGEAAEGTTEILERQPQVEQGTQDHVARRTRKAVEIQNRQTSIILSRTADPRLQPPRFDEREVPLLRED